MDFNEGALNSLGRGILIFPSSETRTAAGDGTRWDPPTLKKALNAMYVFHPPPVFAPGAETLIKIIDNVLKNPLSASNGNEKYRKIKKGNKTFQKKLGRCKGAKLALLTIGFVEGADPDTGEDCYILPSSTKNEKGSSENDKDTDANEASKGEGEKETNMANKNDNDEQEATLMGCLRAAKAIVEESLRIQRGFNEMTFSIPNPNQTSNAQFVAGIRAVTNSLRQARHNNSSSNNGSSSNNNGAGQVPTSHPDPSQIIASTDHYDFEDTVMQYMDRVSQRMTSLHGVGRGRHFVEFAHQDNGAMIFDSYFFNHGAATGLKCRATLIASYSRESRSFAWAATLPSNNGGHSWQRRCVNDLAARSTAGNCPARDRQTYANIASSAFESKVAVHCPEPFLPLVASIAYSKLSHDAVSAVGILQLPCGDPMGTGLAMYLLTHPESQVPIPDRARPDSYRPDDPRNAFYSYM